MFAVVRTGGKQYRVSPGDILAVEKLEGEAGDSITLNEVLAVGGGDKPQLGSPFVKDASVTAEIIAHDRGDKVIAFKKKRRHTYRRKIGHRQHQTILRITAVPGATYDAAAAKKAKKEPAVKKEAKAPAAKKATAAKPKAAAKPAAKAKAAAKTSKE